MITACSACDGPLPDQGVYSISLSLRPDAPKRWRILAMACSLPCLAEVVGQMEAGAQRRQHSREDLAAVMTRAPKGR